MVASSGTFFWMDERRYVKRLSLVHRGAERKANKSEGLAQLHGSTKGGSRKFSIRPGFSTIAVLLNDGDIALELSELIE
jgi:hypothetical protein